MFWRRRDPRDFEAEIRAHLQLEAERLKAQGLDQNEATMAARRAFGNITRTQERFYESQRWLCSDLLQDVRFGLRMLAKNPGSTIVAVVTLALGIGANTAIFSILDPLVLRDLPVVHQPNELVLFGKGEWAGSEDELPNKSWQLFSYPMYREFQQKNRVFAELTAIDSILMGTHGRVAAGSELEKLNVELVSGTYFNTLGVNPVLGRVFSGADDQPPGAHPVAVASYSWWRRRFAKDRNVLGTPVTIGSAVYTILGVAPSNFVGVTVGQSPDLWIPLAMEKQISPSWNGLEDKLFQSLYILARRKPGVSVQQASADTNLLFKQILHEYAGPQPSAKQLESIQHAHIELTSAATGLSPLRIQIASPLKIMMAVVVLVLLIACANVANLLLARAAARRREVAVRMSIGAARSRLIRQLLVESGLLGLSGAIIGVFFAWGAIRLLVSALPFGSSPIDIAPNGQVLGFTLGIASLTVLLFGMAPAVYSTRVDLAPALKEGRGTLAVPVGNRLSRGLVTGQVCLSLMLLVFAGMFLHSLVNLMNVNPGFDKQNVLLMGIDPSGAGYSSGARLELVQQRIEQRVASIPGVRAASFAFFIFNSGEWSDPVVVPGHPKSEDDPAVTHNIVGSQYLDVMGMPLLVGRKLTLRDNSAAPKVAVINETMARAYFSGDSPVGRTFSLGKEPQWQNIAVVGVVKDAKYTNLREKQRPAAFYPHAQHDGRILYDFAVRYTGDANAIGPEIRKAIAAVDPNLSVSDALTLNQLVASSVLNQRIAAELSTFFGLLAAFLACIGIYGVVSYGITRRINEFGIRMALGAERQDVLWMVLRETAKLVLAGVALGLVLAVVSTRLVQSQLFRVNFYDPLAIAIAVGAMLGVALFAGYLPARRATRIDPLSALRYE